jgi:hypothetical protein
MTENTKIICDSCNKDTRLTKEQFTKVLLTSNVACPLCGYPSAKEVIRPVWEPYSYEEKQMAFLLYYNLFRKPK